jgi:hypothetical protein
MLPSATTYPKSHQPKPDVQFILKMSRGSTFVAAEVGKSRSTNSYRKSKKTKHDFSAVKNRRAEGGVFSSLST